MPDRSGEKAEFWVNVKSEFRQLDRAWCAGMTSVNGKYPGG